MRVEQETKDRCVCRRSSFQQPNPNPNPTPYTLRRPLPASSARRVEQLERSRHSPPKPTQQHAAIAGSPTLGEGSNRYKVKPNIAPNALLHRTSLKPPPPQLGLGGGQSTLDVVEHSLHNRFDSLTRAGARLPPLPQQHTSPAQPSSSSPSSRHAIHNPSPPPLQQSSSSPKPTPSSSRLPTSASHSPAAMLQSAAAALADIRKSGTAAAISER